MLRFAWSREVPGKSSSNTSTLMYCNTSLIYSIHRLSVHCYIKIHQNTLRCISIQLVSCRNIKQFHHNKFPEKQHFERGRQGHCRTAFSFSSPSQHRSPISAPSMQNTPVHKFRCTELRTAPSGWSHQYRLQQTYRHERMEAPVRKMLFD